MSKGTIFSKITEKYRDEVVEKIKEWDEMVGSCGLLQKSQ